MRISTQFRLACVTLLICISLGVQSQPSFSGGQGDGGVQKISGAPHSTNTTTQAASGSAPATVADIKQAEPHKFTNNKATDSPSEWWLVCLTAALALFTAWLVIETRRLVDEASKTSKRQEGEMKQSLSIATQAAQAAEKAANASLVAQRPWLSCNVEVSGPLTYSPEGDAKFDFRFTVTNVGHSPAMGVRLTPNLNLMSPKHEHSILMLQRMADHNHGMPVRSGAVLVPGAVPLGDAELGLVLFPGEKQIFNYRLPLKREEIERSCEDIKPDMHFFPELFGLVTYTYPLATIRAETGFVFRVEKAQGDGRFGGVFELGQEVQAENMRISEHSLWSGFAS